MISLLLISTGCVSKKTTPSPFNNTIANNIERTAKSLLGTDYQYGANGPSQFDCSGFTKYVFSQQGINLPRISKDQAKIGEYLQAKQLQKGDLVFFDSESSSIISHVGIYLEQGNFIHASSAKDKVTISTLNSNYYTKHFKWGRRVTNINSVMR
ncbi:MAG: Putative secreted protein [uncultured Sulfurovum sp.]|uniref:Secreted protein n=1 Tax=uncultured Sulfurovum sp. TaxID=269237 RepID=A0A6S6SCN4_9BACT|nr:MAG: Putative secreted protein [uncultured Sulfurovum sp.]